MAAIALEEVTKRYGSGEAAVAEVTLDVADGEFVILVGPSGCGKSTLLRMIAGLEEITSGEIRIDGERVNERPPRERNLAMVFQNYALYPHLSVFENIAFPLRLAKEPAPDVRRRVSEAARLLDLGDLLDRRPAQLSGGQRQRVAMGRALVRQPKAFLFDEPLSNLDARLRAQMRTEIARLQRRLAATTVYVTHDQTEAMTLGHRVAVLRRGVLQQVAPPRELYQHPRNLFVAGFLGSPAMNFVPGILEGRRLRLPFTTVEVPERMARGTTDGPIVAGIRPEHFDDAALVDGDTRHRGVTFTARIEATEWLGSEQFAYVPFAVPEGMRERLRALARDLDQESFRPELVVSLGPEGRISAGTTAELWLDQAQLQLFEVDTGENVT